jgi:REP element-mobilizing transposase RayT
VPRKPRVHGADTTYHVTVLAVAGTLLFADIEERLLMYRVLDYTLKHHDWEIRSFVLMSTHMHLVVWTRDDDLARGMQRMLGIYAQVVNRQRERKGHVVCGRFWSKPIVDDEQAKSTLRYIALNPVEAGIVERPEDWTWGSYRAQLLLDPPPPFLTTAWGPRLFHDDPWRAAVLLRAFVDEGLKGQGVRPLDPNGHAGDGWG